MTTWVGLCPRVRSVEIRRWKSVVGNRSSDTGRWKPVDGVQEVVDTERLLDCERPADCK